MKKVISLLMAFVMIMTFASCSEKKEEKEEKKTADKKEEVTVSLDLDLGSDKDGETKAPEKDEEPPKNEEKVTYLICTEMTYEPFAFTYPDGDNGGFEIDLMNEIADISGFNVFIRNEEFSSECKGEICHTTTIHKFRRRIRLILLPFFMPTAKHSKSAGNNCCGKSIRSGLTDAAGTRITIPKVAMLLDSSCVISDYRFRMR